MTDIEKLVEECGEALCALIYKEGAWATIDAEDRRLYLRDARAVIRRTLEWAANQCNADSWREVANKNPADERAHWRYSESFAIAMRLRSLASAMENDRG